MTPRELWERYKAPAVRRPRPRGAGSTSAARGSAKRPSPSGSRRSRRALDGDGRARGRGDRQPGREAAWSATTGCGPRRWRPTPEIAAAIRDTRARVLDFAARVHDGRGEAARAPSASATCWSSASADRPSARSSWPTPSAARGDRLSPALPRQHRPRRHRPRPRRPRRAASPRRWPSSSRSRAARPRRATACSRRRPPTARAASSSAPTRSRSRRRGAPSTGRPASRASSRASRCGTGWAAAPR